MINLKSSGRMITNKLQDVIVEMKRTEKRNKRILITATQLDFNSEGRKLKDKMAT